MTLSTSRIARLALLSLVSISAPPAADAEFYVWRDEAGRRHISTHPLNCYETPKFINTTRPGCGPWGSGTTVGGKALHRNGGYAYSSEDPAMDTELDRMDQAVRLACSQRAPKVSVPNAAQALDVDRLSSFYGQLSRAQQAVVEGSEIKARCNRAIAARDAYVENMRNRQQLAMQQQLSSLIQRKAELDSTNDPTGEVRQSLAETINTLSGTLETLAQSQPKEIIREKVKVVRVPTMAPAPMPATSNLLDDFERRRQKQTLDEIQDDLHDIKRDLDY